MIFNKKLVLAFLFLVFVGMRAIAVDVPDVLLPGDELYPTQEKIFNDIALYWKVQEAYYQYSLNPTTENEIQWTLAVEEYEKISIVLGKEILYSIKKDQYGQIELLSKIYKSLPLGARNALYYLLGYMKVEISHNFSKYISEEKFREYFPGYGYTEPGYKYRKGREIEREYKGATWQSEEHSISTTWNVNLTISVDLLNILSNLVNTGAIKNLEIGPQYQIEVNGQPMIVCNVSFQRIKSIVTKTNRKFEINKVWFELLRAESSFWSEGPWEVVGKTYEILQEPTGEAVVTGIEGV